MRVPVISKENIALMPTKPGRARRWVKEGKAIGKFNKLGIYYVQLVGSPSDFNTQDIAIGLDPGKMFSGVGVQSPKFTLQMLHLVLPFKTVKKRMENRAMMRRCRRGRRINRKIDFSKRAHREKRFDNRKGKKLPPSIRANKDLEFKVVSELCKLYPATVIIVESIQARGNKGFSPVMVGQKQQIERLGFLSKVNLREGWETSNLRQHLGLHKEKSDKSLQVPETHAVDAVTLACSEVVQFKKWHDAKNHGASWVGHVEITASQFTVVRRLPVSRRQLHLMVPSISGKRRKYGGTTTRHGFRKGDYVHATLGEKTFFGWVSGDTKTQVSVSDFDWERLGQCSVKKVRLVQRNTGLLVSSTRKLLNLTVSNR